MIEVAAEGAKHTTNLGLSISEWVQIISTLFSGLAAIAAWVTTIQNRKSIKSADKERDAMVKPHFQVTGMNSDGNLLKITLNNIGYNSFYPKEIYLERRPDLHGIIYNYKNENSKYTIEIPLKEFVPKQRETIIINYVNALGKKKMECIEITFDDQRPIAYRLVEK